MYETVICQNLKVLLTVVPLHGAAVEEVDRLQEVHQDLGLEVVVLDPNRGQDQDQEVDQDQDQEVVQEAVLVLVPEALVVRMVVAVCHGNMNC